MGLFVYKFHKSIKDKNYSNLFILINRKIFVQELAVYSAVKLIFTN